MARSYTWGSPEGVQAVINSLPDRYPMELVAEDMEVLIRGLAYVADSDACAGEGGNPDDHMDNRPAECLDSCWRVRAVGLLSSIAETVGVEWI
jgi:hypothetical protein